MSENEIRIVAEPQPNPDICKFVVDRPLFPGRSYHCPDRVHAKGSPLLEALYEVRGVAEALVSENSISVLKDNDSPWPELGKLVGAAIRKALRTGNILLDPKLGMEESGPSHAHSPTSLSLENPLARRVHEIIVNHINPSVASHGGQVTLVDVQDRKAFVRLGGGCHGCGMANATLRQGIEKMICQSIPEIEAVIDVTDHSTGANPYFKRS